MLDEQVIETILPRSTSKLNMLDKQVIETILPRSTSKLDMLDEQVIETILPLSKSAPDVEIARFYNVYSSYNKSAEFNIFMIIKDSIKMAENYLIMN
jgi:hypothetical protein